MTAPHEAVTGTVDSVERALGLAWFGINAPLDRAQDESAKYRALAKDLERDLTAAREAKEAERAELWRANREANGSLDACKAACESLRVERDACHGRIDRLEADLAKARDAGNFQLERAATRRTPPCRERRMTTARGPSDWMCTFTGTKYYPAAPRVDEVKLLDIAHHLSRLNRYTGAIRTEHYSVAEHSVHVSRLVAPQYALQGLMHDAPEAYLNDMNRPAKHHLPDYQHLEDLNWRVIAQKFGLPFELHPSVKEADVAMLEPERHALMPRMDEWPVMRGVQPAKVEILALSPNKAKLLFLDRFIELTSGFGMVGRSYPRLPLITDCAAAVAA